MALLQVFFKKFTKFAQFKKYSDVCGAGIIKQVSMTSITTNTRLKKSKREAKRCKSVVLLNACHLIVPAATSPYFSNFNNFLSCWNLKTTAQSAHHRPLRLTKL